MGLPTRIRDSLLYVTSSPADRLNLFQVVVSTARADDGCLVALAGSDTIPALTSAVDLAGLDHRDAAVMNLQDAARESGAAWQGLCDACDSLVAELVKRNGDRPIILLVDLDAAFTLCQAASEMMSLVYHLNREHVARGRRVASMVSVQSLPQSMPVEFFDLHPTWAIADSRGSDGVGALDTTAEQLALASPEFRQRFLASARTESASALRLVPSFFDDYRRGILMVDRRFAIRFCSPRAAALLGRSPEQLINRLLSTCIDGVDLVTVKHECEKLAPGRTPQSPFIASWRIAPGVYEPREVSIDPVRSGHQTIGYIVTLSQVESVRGPRAVYLQLKEEKATSVPTRNEQDDDDLVTEDETVSGDLHGTQITRREHEIILLILRDMTNKQIAERLSIAEVTVKKHLTSVYRKLRITSRRELAMSFARPGSKS